MHLLFARHGESVANTRQVFANRPGGHFPLTARGRAHARDLARRLASEPIGHVYSSPLPRALETAAIVAAARELKVSVAPALREYDVGAFELQPYGGDHAWRMGRYADNEVAWRRGEHDHRLEGGESLPEIVARVGEFIVGLRAAHGETETILLVGHGGLYRIALPLVLAGLDPAIADAHGLDHVAIVRAIATAGSARCVQWGDVAIGDAASIP
jgi:probable phosphoglycerate mutase